MSDYDPGDIIDCLRLAGYMVEIDDESGAPFIYVRSHNHTPTVSEVTRVLGRLGKMCSFCQLPSCVKVY